MTFVDEQASRWRRRAWMLALAGLLAGVYLLSYRGFPISLDEVALFSTTESVVKYREVKLVSLYHEYPVAGDLLLIDSPWTDAIHEPLMYFLASPVYWLALQMNSLGTMHVVWIMNIAVTIGIVLTIFRTGIAWGYGEWPSLLTALTLALGSMLFPYSQTFFREPLFALLTLLAFVLARDLRRSWGWWRAVALVIVSGAALLTKSVAILGLPALAVLLLPQLSGYPRRRLLGIVVLVVVIGVLIIVGVGYFAGQLTPGSDRFSAQDIEGRVRDSELSYLLTVVGAYLVSPGRSLWATSPALLLAFPGAILALRRGDWRLALAPFVLLIAVTLGYGLTGWDWHGGRGWGTRYLLHVVPVMGLLLLPVMQSLVNSGRARFWRVAAGLLIGFSLVIQLAGVLVSIDRYYGYIQARFPDDSVSAFYDKGTWELQYTQWFIHLKEFDPTKLDVAWHYVDAFWRGPLIAALLMLVSLAFWGYFRQRPERLAARTFATSAVILATLIVGGYGFALGALRTDTRIMAERPELHQLVEAVEARTDGDDIVFLSDPEYRDFFLNFFKGDARLVVLPYAPGERYSFEQVPRVESDNPDERLDVETRFPLDYAAQHYDDLWLVSNRGPFYAWAYRPVEQYLARHFYPVESLEDIAPNARLIHFDLTPAPAYDTTYHTLYIPARDPFQFGDHITLAGYILPDRAAPGSVLPISLEWVSDGDVDFDDNVGVFLINADGVLVSARNGAPQGTFGYTSRWEAGVPQGDNHGLQVPADVPPGDYTVQVVMYDWRDAQRLPVTRDGVRVEGDFAEIGTVQIAGD